MNDAARAQAGSSPGAPGPAASGSGVRAALDGARLDVVLDRPEVHNAQTPATWRAFHDLLTALPSDVRVVVVSGAGPSFSSGLDRRMFSTGVPGEPSLGGLAALPAQELDDTIAAFQQGFTCWKQPGVLSIAAVHGAAIGAGFQLALACDLIVAADDARFVMAEPTLGLVPDLGGTQPLVRRVGTPRATEICLTGRAVSGAEAARIGLAEVAVGAGDVAATVDDLVAAVLALPATSGAATLDLLRGAASSGDEEQRRAERYAQGELLRGLAAARKSGAPAAVDGG